MRQLRPEHNCGASVGLAGSRRLHVATGSGAARARTVACKIILPHGYVNEAQGIVSDVVFIKHLNLREKVT